MKKNLFMVAAVALMAMVSCNKEEVNNGGVNTTPEPTVIVEFEAGFDIETKTALDAEGKKTVWTSEDRISINGQEFKVYEIREDGKAIFVNVADLPSNFAAPFTAIYPYGSEGKVPAEQTAVAGNFDPKAVIEKATSDNYSLSFKNETSLLKFQVPTACKTVKLSSDTNLATSSATVTITGEFKTGTDYYVAVIPGEKKNFSVMVDDYVVKSAELVKIGGSSIIPMELPYNIYLHAKTERCNWASDGARFATWTWGTGVTDSWFNLVAEGGHEGVYRLEVPKGYTTCNFVRMDGNKPENTWDNKWNQTGNLNIPKDEKNHFYIKEWDGQVVEWGTKDHKLPLKVSFTLTTDNSKQWWNADDNTYLYLEINNKAQIGSWPGQKMTKEGDYTWSTEIPNNLKDKTVYLQIHNNSGWIGKKSNVKLGYSQSFLGKEDLGIN